MALRPTRNRAVTGRERLAHLDMFFRGAEMTRNFFDRLSCAPRKRLSTEQKQQTTKQRHTPRAERRDTNHRRGNNDDLNSHETRLQFIRAFRVYAHRRILKRIGARVTVCRSVLYRISAGA